MKGVLYGVGVGPGDSEMLTLKAVRLLETAAVIAVPDVKGVNTALEIVSQYTEGKDHLYCPMPMTKNLDILQAAHEEAAAMIIERLEHNDDVAFITLGDPTIYSTFMYIRDIVMLGGYETQIISGVTSFCASAAVLGIELCLGNKPLHIIPALSDKFEEMLALSGTKVIMKSGSQIANVKNILKKHGLYQNACAVERCGTKNERIYYNLDDMPDDAAYFSTIIIKEEIV